MAAADDGDENHAQVHDNHAEVHDRLAGQYRRLAALRRRAAAATDRAESLEERVARDRLSVAAQAERVADQAEAFAAHLEAGTGGRDRGGDRDRDHRLDLARRERRIAAVERRNALKLREAGTGPLHLEPPPPLTGPDPGPPEPVPKV